MSCLVLRVEKQKLSESIDEMKALVRSSHNKAEEVITHAEEELALAKLIKRGADRDLVQAQRTIEDLSGKLAVATENWNVLWKSFRSVADVLRTPVDDGQSWAQFIPRILTRSKSSRRSVLKYVPRMCWPRSGSLLQRCLCLR